MKPDQAALFDRLATGPCLYAYSDEALAKLDALVPSKGRVLDVGCGDGSIGQVLTADRVAGLDVSVRCVTLAHGRGLDAVAADAVAGIPFRDEAFDTVYCVDVLHHLDMSWEPVFKEIDRVLRPSGTLAIVEPDATNPFVRWTQAPGSPIRVAPSPNEPAIDPAVLFLYLERLGYPFTCRPIHIEGRQMERSLFPLWQRVLKAPFVLALAFWCRNVPNKFAIVATKPV